jgi:hypothetical protein
MQVHWEYDENKPAGQMFAKRAHQDKKASSG